MTNMIKNQFGKLSIDIWIVNLKENKNDADIIFITHSHYDHFSINDINKIKKR